MGMDGLDDDPDNEKVSNYLEFALGTDPNSDTSFALPSNHTVTEGMAEYPGMQYIRRQNVSGLAVQVEAFTGIPFNSSVPTTETDVEDLMDGNERVMVRANTPLSMTTTVFFRTNIVND